MFYLFVQLLEEILGICRHFIIGELILLELWDLIDHRILLIKSTLFPDR